MSRSDSGRSDDSLLEWMLLWVLALCFGGSGLLWLVGGTAAVTTGGDWPSTDVGDMGGVLLRLLDRPGTPSAAWPPTDRSLIPGALVFYGVAAIFGLLLAGTAYALLSLRSRTRTTSDPRSARWADRRDLRPLMVRRPGEGRLVIGRVGRRLIAAEKRQSLIVFGPTQTGKTTGLAIPAILEWDGPVVSTSVKMDLLRDTEYARRRRDGDVLAFDPAGVTGRASAGWSPLSASLDWQGAQRTAAVLSSAGRSSASRTASDDFWQQMAMKMLAPYLFAAANAGMTMRDVLRWIDRRDMSTPGRLLDEIGDTDARDAADASWARPEEGLASTFATCEATLAVFADPTVDRATRASDIHPVQMLDGREHALYLCAPAHEQQRLAPIFAALVLELVNAVYLEAARRAEPIEPGLLLVLDEAANIAPVPRLDTIASTGAGQGLQLVSVFQDFAQVRSVYGHAAASIASNHRAKLLLGGISDRDTLEYAVRVLGEEGTVQVSTSHDSAGRRSRSESVALRPLAPPHSLRTLDVGEALLIYGRLPAARLQLRPWWDE